jgi:hypothetical protein
VLGLARLDSPQRVFHVALDHQSREDQAVNGTATAVSYGADEKRFPFVLMLDGIVSSLPLFPLFPLPLRLHTPSLMSRPDPG